MNAKDLDDIRQLSLIFGFFIAVPGGWTWLKVHSHRKTLNKLGNRYYDNIYIEDKDKQRLRDLRSLSRLCKFFKAMFCIGLFLVTFGLVLGVCVYIFNNFVL